MRVLLDECLPKKLKKEIRDCWIATAPEMGWAGKKNGELLRLADGQFDVFITADQNLRYQQNPTRLKIAIVFLDAEDTALQTLLPLIPKIQYALRKIRPHEFIRIGN